jgi:hypothetical protein
MIAFATFDSNVLDVLQGAVDRAWCALLPRDNQGENGATNRMRMPPEAAASVLRASSDGNCAGSKVRFSLIGEPLSCPADMSPICR